MGFMYLPESKQRRADGRVVTYLQLAENVWDAAKGRSQASLVHNGGRADSPEVIERLRRLAKNLRRRGSPEEMVTVSGDGCLICAWPYGDRYVLEAIRARLGIGDLVRQQADARPPGFNVERALFALVANRACAPASKRYGHEPWLKEDTHIEGTPSLQRHQFYRAMDFLEANKDAIEQAIFYRVADLLNLDVDVIFHDTTSLHFEIDDEDSGDAPGHVKGSQAAGKKTCTAPPKAGPPQERSRRRPADRGGSGRHPGRIPGTLPGISGQHGRRHYGGQSQGRPPGLATQPLPLRGGGRDGFASQPANAGPRRWQVPAGHTDAPW